MRKRKPFAAARGPRPRVGGQSSPVRRAPLQEGTSQYTRICRMDTQHSLRSLSETPTVANCHRTPGLEGRAVSPLLSSQQSHLPVQPSTPSHLSIRSIRRACPTTFRVAVLASTLRRQRIPVSSFPLPLSVFSSLITEVHHISREDLRRPPKSGCTIMILSTT